jgi:hypothetical protein
MCTIRETFPFLENEVKSWKLFENIFKDILTEVCGAGKDCSFQFLYKSSVID